MKRCLLVLMCCLLFVGCSKAEVVDESSELEIPSSNSIRELIPIEKPVTEEVDNDTIDVVEEQESTELLEEEILNAEDFEGVKFEIDKETPIELKIANKNGGYIVGYNEPTNSVYVKLAGTMFVYSDGVNYTTSNDVYHKCTGDSQIYKEHTLYNYKGIRLRNVTSAKKIDNEIMVEGTYYYNDRYEMTATVKLDASTKEVISYDGTSDDDSKMLINCTVLDEWDPLPDVEFEEVDEATLSEDIFAMQLQMLFSGLSDDIDEQLGYTTDFTIEIADVFEYVDEEAIKDIVEELRYKYDIMYECAGRTGYTLEYYFVAKEEPNENTKESIKQDIINYLSTLPDTTLYDSAKIGAITN